MKIVYLDTNIILSPIRHIDENFNHVMKILQLKHISFITGTITLVEMASVLAREKELIHNFFKIEFKKISNQVKELDINRLISIIIDYLINLFNIKILDDSFFEKYSLSRQEINISSVYNLAISQIQNTELRTLDQLHFMTAYFNFIVNDIDITYLVTADINFLNKSSYLQKLSKIIVISLESFANLEFGQ